MSRSDPSATTPVLPSANHTLSEEARRADPLGTFDAARPAISRAQDAVLALGRRAVAAPDPDVLVSDAARMIAEIAGTEFALIARSESGAGQRLVPVTEEAENPTGDSDAEGPRLAESASKRAHPIVVPDLLHCDVYSDRYLAQNNIRGALVVPLRLQNASFGALGACSSHRIDFEVDAIYVAETIAHLVATTLAHYRSEALFQESRRVSEMLYDTVDAIVVVIDSSGLVQKTNRGCAEISGFNRDDFRDRPVWSVLAPPEEMGAYRDAIARLATAGPPLALEASLLTKHSQRRVIAWRFAASPAVNNAKRCFLLTGIDITKQRRAEERAERAKKALAHLRPADPAAWGKNGPECEPSGRSGELASGRRPTESERRLKPRRPFPYRQNVAFMTGLSYPREDEFIEVRCRDIAAGGFSFVSPQLPESHRLVVALGSPRHLTYLTARVVHVTEFVENNTTGHLVGCQYTGRAPS